MTPVLNRALERWRRTGARALGERARKVRERRPLVVVPSILGTKIVDDCGCVLWGSVKRLYVGPPIVTAQRAVATGLLDGFTVLPGVYRYDVFGGMLRFLERVGGYRRGVDLFVLEYDWRESVLDGASRLADLVAQMRGTGQHGAFDMLAISTGGLVARHFLARRGEPVGRVVYVGTPHRGSFQALSTLHAGVQMVPLGRRIPPYETAACKTCWDGLPHPDERVFLEEDGAPLATSLYEPSAWRSLGLGPPVHDLEQQLERAHDLHRSLDAAAPHADSIVIGARHLPTLSKLPVIGGRVTLPACSPRKGDPLAAALFEPGDTSLPTRSLDGLPGLTPDRIRSVTVDEHRLLPAHAQVHQLALEALLEAAP